MTFKESISTNYMESVKSQLRWTKAKQQATMLSTNTKPIALLQNERKVDIPEKETRDDRIIMISDMQIRAALFLKVTDGSCRTFSRRLVNQCQLRSCKPDRKPRLTVEKKKKRLVFTKSMIIGQRKKMSKQHSNSLLCVRVMLQGTQEIVITKKYAIQTKKHSPRQMCLEQLLYLTGIVVKSIRNFRRIN